MTNKEYKEKRESIETYGGYDFLTDYEVKELRKDCKDRKGFTLPGFNNRATVCFENGLYILTSYYTKVFSFDPVKRTGKKLWDGYSKTTLKHINLFCDYVGIKGYSKREWIEEEA